MPTDPGAFCCIALGRGVFFWQNDRRLCPRAGEMEMSSTEMAKRWASHALVAFFPSQKIKDPKCLQKSQDNHDFLPVTSISSGFKTRDLWWHDSFQALEKVPVCSHSRTTPWFLGGCVWGTHCSLHTPNDLEANRPRSHFFLRGPICHQPSRLEIASSIHCTENIKQTCLVLVFHPSSCMLFSNQAPQISIPRHHSLGHVDQGSQVDGFRLSAQT